MASVGNDGKTPDTGRRAAPAKDVSPADKHQGVGVTR
jgi:hypothetical protein